MFYLFDFDGTLFDTQEVLYKSYKDACEQYGYELSREDFNFKCMGKDYRIFLKDVFPKMPLRIVSLVHESKIELYSQYTHNVKANDELFDIVKAAKAFKSKTAIVTTASKQAVIDIFAYSDYSLNLFDTVVTKEDVEKTKPSPDAYIKVMKIFGADPQQCIVYEDDEIGSIAAHNACIQDVRIPPLFV